MCPESWAEEWVLLPFVSFINPCVGHWPEPGVENRVYNRTNSHQVLRPDLSLRLIDLAVYAAPKKPPSHVTG